MKILSVGAELLHADGQADIKNLTVASCNFAKASNKCWSRYSDLI